MFEEVDCGESPFVYLSHFFHAMKPAHSYADEKIGCFDLKEVMLKSDAGKKATVDPPSCYFLTSWTPLR